jgi:iron(III) transport system ATP-binding protein
MAEPEVKSPAFLKISNLWKSFGEFLALKDISLEVTEGEFVCFLGPSGCGKTTLLRAIAGLDPQTRGTIEQSTRDISNLPPAQRDYGIVFQSYALFPNLSIRRNIAYGLENAGHSRSAIDSRVDELLQLIGLPEQGKKYPAQLSGGQQQRIALARAIATQPGLLLLDEPLSALDAKVRVSLRHQIKELQRKLGVTTIMVTHDQEEGLSMADRIVVMNHGRIEQIGTPIQIYRDPDTLFVADFIGEMNQVQAVVEAADRVRIGELSFTCLPHRFAPGKSVIATVRPEDIVPVEDRPADHSDHAVQGVEVSIGDMEFLGSYWRAGLDSSQLSGRLSANLSMNAVRRMELEIGSRLQVRLPAERLKLFTSAVAAPDE